MAAPFRGCVGGWVVTAPVSTDDPVVAVFYGASAFPSLAAGLAAVVDLVAGQPGPWGLADTARAAQVDALLARVRGATPVPAAAAGARVVEDLERARRHLFDLFCAFEGQLPVHLLHHVEQLEARLAGFVADHGDELRHLTPTPPATTAAAPDEPVTGSEASEPDGGRVPFPSIDAAIRYESKNWHDLIRSRNLAVAEVKAEHARRYREHGQVPPANLSGFKGNRSACELMLRVISDADMAAHPPSGERG